MASIIMALGASVYSWPWNTQTRQLTVPLQAQDSHDSQRLSLNSSAMSFLFRRMVGELKKPSARACSSDCTRVFVTETAISAARRICETSDKASLQVGIGANTTGTDIQIKV